MIKNTSGLAVQPCRLHERFYYHARLLYYILRQKARGFFDAGAAAPAPPCFLSASPEGFCGGGSPSTHQWAYPAHTRGSFRFTTKGTKGVPGLCPWTPEGGTLSPLRRCRTPQIGLSATKKDRFATLSCWANRSLFFPQARPGVTPPAVNPWRGRGLGFEDA